MSNVRRIVLAAAIFCLAAPLMATLQAQSTAPDSSEAMVNAVPVASTAPALSSPAAGARVAPVGVTAPEPEVQGGRTLRAAAPSNAVAAAGEKGSHNVGLMVVGGAALLVGALVGGTPGGVIMAGGAIVGLVGLWRYLQ